MSNFEEWLLSLVKPEVKAAETAANAFLVAFKPKAIAYVESLETVDLPAVAAFIAKDIPKPGGIFGGLVEDEEQSLITSVLKSLPATIDKNDSAWYDDFVAAFTKAEGELNTELGIS